ncbi:MAG: glycoside hydrolase family 43 protein [Rhodothermales bacterium]
MTIHRAWTWAFSRRCAWRLGALILLLACPSRVSAQPRTYTNPVGDSIFVADPSVLTHQGRYYLYGTSAGDGFRAWTSENLVDWNELGYVYRKQAGTWGQGSFWAPEVVRYRDRFYLIYSSRGPAAYGDGYRITIAVADRPEGPFEDLYSPLFDPGYSMIDAHLFIDDGKPYLFFEMVGLVGSLGNDKGYLWGVIMGVELSEDLSRPLTEPKLCLYPTQEWEGVSSMWARSNEGMTVFKAGDTYYMTYSGNHYRDPNYGVGYATAEHPLGMWTKYAGNPILKQDPSLGVSGPGHNSITVSPDGSEQFIVYHSHADPANPSGRRVLNIDRLIVRDDGTLEVVGPTRTPQPMPAGSAR